MLRKILNHEGPLSKNGDHSKTDPQLPKLYVLLQDTVSGDTIDLTTSKSYMIQEELENFMSLKTRQMKGSIISNTKMTRHKSFFRLQRQKFTLFDTAIGNNKGSWAYFEEYD